MRSDSEIQGWTSLELTVIVYSALWNEIIRWTCWVLKWTHTQTSYYTWWPTVAVSHLIKDETKNYTNIQSIWFAINMDNRILFKIIQRYLLKK